MSTEKEKCSRKGRLKASYMFANKKKKNIRKKRCNFLKQMTLVMTGKVHYLSLGSRNGSQTGNKMSNTQFYSSVGYPWTSSCSRCYVRNMFSCS